MAESAGSRKMVTQAKLVQCYLFPLADGFHKSVLLLFLLIPVP